MKTIFTFLLSFLLSFWISSGIAQNLTISSTSPSAGWVTFTTAAQGNTANIVGKVTINGTVYTVTVSTSTTPNTWITGDTYASLVPASAATIRANILPATGTNNQFIFFGNRKVSNLFPANNVTFTISPAAKVARLNISDADAGGSTNTFNDSYTITGANFTNYAFGGYAGANQPTVTKNSANIPIAYSDAGTLTEFTRHGDASGTSTSVTVTFDKAGVTSYNSVTAYAIQLAAPEAALPVVLKSFEANAQGLNAILNWKSGVEEHFSGYYVEQRNDASSMYQSKQFIAAKGTNTSYRTEISMLPGNNFFRLKMVDLNGEFSYSEEVMVKNDQEVLSFFPSVVYSNMYSYNTKAGDILNVYDPMGRVVLRQVIHTDNQLLNLTSLQSGKYFMNIVRNNRQIHTNQFLKK